MVMVEELYMFYIFTMVNASMFMVEPLSPYMYLVMVSFLVGTFIVDMMRNITINTTMSYVWIYGYVVVFFAL